MGRKIPTDPGLRKLLSWAIRYSDYRGLFSESCWRFLGISGFCLLFLLGEGSSTTGSFQKSQASLLTNQLVNQHRWPVFPMACLSLKLGFCVGSFGKNHSFHAYINMIIYIYLHISIYIYMYGTLMMLIIVSIIIGCIQVYMHMCILCIPTHTSLHYRVIALIFPCERIADFTGHLLCCHSFNFLPLPNCATSPQIPKAGEEAVLDISLPDPHPTQIFS